MLALIAAMSLISPNFFTVENFLTVFRNITYTMLLACGLTFVFLGGGFDLSQGATLILTATLMVSVSPPGPLLFFATLLLVLAAAVAIGLLNGYLIGIHRLNPFVVTLGVRSIVGGFIFIYAAGAVISAAVPSPILEFVGLNRLFGYLPVLVLAWFLIAAACWFVIRYTPFSRKVAVVGSSLTVARFSGLQVKRLSLSTYVINGFLAGLAGVLVAAQTSYITPSLVWHYDFDAITACALGGISLAGGRGSIVNTISGVLFLGFINNSMILLGLPYPWQLILKGGVLLAAIITDMQSKRSYA
jgi:ribose transport system permease protein